MTTFAAQRSNFDQLEPSDRLPAPNSTPPQLGAELLANAGAMEHLRAMNLSGSTSLTDFSLVRNEADLAPVARSAASMSMSAAENSEPTGLSPELWWLLASPNERGHAVSRAKKNGGDATI